MIKPILKIIVILQIFLFLCFKKKNLPGNKNIGPPYSPAQCPSSVCKSLKKLSPFSTVSNEEVAFFDKLSSFA